MKEELKEICKTAFDWWLQRRPCRWTQAMHLANPEINCVNHTECRLALAVAVMVKDLEVSNEQHTGRNGSGVERQGAG